MKDSGTNTTAKVRGGSWMLLLALLGGALAVVCNQAFKAHYIMWANDTQFGPSTASASRLPDTFWGAWLDFWWIGSEMPSASPTLAAILATLISPAMFLKIFTPLTMLLLGFSAWVLFRQLKFAPIVCVLGGLAAGLNMHCFSTACWGLGTWNIAIAMIFLALAVLVTDSIRQTWIKAILAGLAVGMSVMEGFDSGAIMSVYVGVFTAFFCWVTESTVTKKLIKTIWVEVLVVLAAVLIAFNTVYSLVGTQIVGIAGPGESAQAKWTFSTQFSLPKLETLRVIIPGIFGYRMEEFSTPPDPLAASLGEMGGWPGRFIQGLTDKTSAYWGRVGEDLMWAPFYDLESSDPKVRAAAVAKFTPRADIIEVMRGDNLEIRAHIVNDIRQSLQRATRHHSGNGEYAGVLVALFAIFALLNSLRGIASPYTLMERRLVWFWGGAALFSLVAAWGRFSFLYALLFHVPGVSFIRNPIKFMHPFVIAWVILAGFGLEAFYRCYLRSQPKPSTARQLLQPNRRWRKLTLFDKGCLVGLLLIVIGIFVGFQKYAGSKPALANYITDHGFGDPTQLVIDTDPASRIAAFSIDEARWFVFLFTLSAGVAAGVVAVVCERRWTWAPWAALCGIMIFDLSRADVPWVRYFNYDQKYSRNEVTKFLMDKPWEHRVTGRISQRRPNYDIALEPNFSPVIHWWIENDFPYHDIQTLEIDQMPRAPVLDSTYQDAFPYIESDNPMADLTANLVPASRLWKLTNTRYLLASARLLPALNSLCDPQHHSFRFVQRFNLVPKPGFTLAPTPGLTLAADQGDITPEISDQGNCALIEYGDALPRAKLYSSWLTPPSDQITLQALTSTNWDPAQTVLVSSETPVPPPAAAAGTDPGDVHIASYASTDIKLQATAKTPAVLLYNDRTAKDWRVWVDGKQSQLLRCNYIMRGVFLPQGGHTVEFRFQPSLAPLYVTLSAFAVGILLAAYLIWSRFSGKSPAKTA